MFQVLAIFEALDAHPSVERIGYMLSSRRPCYSDWKWEFMVRVHTLTLQALDASPLRGKVTVLDLRDMVHPLDEFVPADRQHLNRVGHRRKADELLRRPYLWSLAKTAQPPDLESLMAARDGTSAGGAEGLHVIVENVDEGRRNLEVGV